MPTLGYPSPTSPLVPEVRVSVPDSWQAVPSGDALWLGRERSAGERRGGGGPAHDERGGGGPGDDGNVPEGGGEEHTTTLAAYVTTTVEADPDAHLSGFIEEVHEHQEGESDPIFDVELSGRTWTGVNLSWIESGDPVFVVHLVHRVQVSSDEELGELSQFVRLCGRVSGPTAESDYAKLQSIMESVTLGTPAGAV